MPKQTRRGKFLVLDGPDGAGKSTQAKLLSEKLRARGKDVLLLREPGGTAAGEAIRSVLLEHKSGNLSPLTESFLFQAARAQLIEEVIGPALQKGQWVLCDRFTLSTLVYQAYAGGVGPGVVESLSRLATQGITPDLYLVVWVDSKVGTQRRAHRAADRMEAKGDKFIRDVARAFKTLAQRQPRRYKLIDGAAGVDDVAARIWKFVEPLLNK